MKYQSTIKTNRHLQLEALVPRLKPSNPHYQKLNQQLGQDIAGYLGEKNLRYHFEFIAAKKGIHIAGPRFKGSTFYAQLDHLIITPQLMFIIEVKNRKGHISENQHGQYVQQYQQNMVTFDNPKNQVDIQKRQLDYIIRRHGFPTIPIIPLVAFPHQTVQLDATITSSNVMVAQEVSFFINNHLTKHKQQHYNDHQLKQLKKLITTLHEPMKENLIKNNNIPLSDLNPGVLCPKCRREYTQRNYATWTCQKCGESNSLAHIQALRDYANLFGQTINNRTARWWLGINCPGLTYRLLSKFPVVKQVGRKAIEYDLTPLMKK